MPVKKAEIEAVFRREHGHVFSHLVGAYRDFDLVEDALQDAFVRALETWPNGAPQRPGAWITTVARNRILSDRRHTAVVVRTREAVAVAAETAQADDEDIPDERARLLFTCCHPALAEPARIALTLRTVCGLSTPAIARLFLTPESTIAQRLVRAKRKIRSARIPYEMPTGARLTERIDDVLACIYLTFTAGYATLDPTAFTSAEICAESMRLAHVLTHAFPRHAEARALLALLSLHRARQAARIDDHGRVVPLEDQDRAAWDHHAMQAATVELEDALAAGARGRYALQASIAALHGAARTAADTDWSQIAGLYRELLRRDPSPAAFVAWAVAESMADGPAVGLSHLRQAIERGDVTPAFDRVAAARADMLRRAGHLEEAAAAYREALRCARHPHEADFLQRRLAECRAG